MNQGIYIFTDGNICIKKQLNGVSKKVNDVSSKIEIKEAIKKAQSGKIGFEKFIELAGKAGIAY